MQEPKISRVTECKDLVASSVGLWFSEDRLPEFSRGLAGTCRSLGLTEDELWTRLSSGDKPALNSLTENLTIGETYFYRDSQFFQELEKKILNRDFPQESVERKRLRIWSAGCSTGEEPYSIAIALRRCLLGLDNWDVSILATDLNSQSLDKARRGHFGKWSFRSTPDWLVKQYFQKTEDDRLAVLPFIRNLVEFRPLNLAKSHYTSSYNGTKELDLVVLPQCPHVLRAAGGC